MIKLRADEVTTGMTVEANMVDGAHVVTEIKVIGMTMRAGVTAKALAFYNADGVEFFVGRLYAKATVVTA